MIFFVIGEALMHGLHFMHLVFGGFLVYTGIQAAQADDEDEDPTQVPTFLEEILSTKNS